MRYNYQLTPLEQWIEDLYFQKGITSIEQLNMQSLSEQLGIWYYQLNMSSQAIDNNGIYSICIDKRQSPIKQWGDFLHELCHVLRHSGDQTIMPELFMEAQETEAETFALYAAIPFFMFSQLDVPDRRSEAIKYLAETFRVSTKFAEKRLDQIERRVLQAQFTAQLEIAATLEVPVSQTDIYAYYDYSADVPGPTQFVLEIDAIAMDSSGDFLFSLEDRFKRLESEDIQDLTGIQLKWTDLIYKDGQVGINFPTIALKYGSGSKRFVIHMKDIEQLLQYEIGCF